ncbi:hypothetical protein SNEBB_003913 [Seison nebaliae]|nr:hypothetical protein SNEBB_003913 [Seison nebaliae]
MRLQPCYGRDAKCVKIYEVKGSETHYARGCLSELESVRMDMPTVRENGCWTKDNQYLGHGRRVFSNEQLTKQQNIYCFCNERDGCNSVRMNKVHILILFFPIILLYFSS